MSPDQHRADITDRIAALEARLTWLEDMLLTAALAWQTVAEEATGERIAADAPVVAA